MRAGGRDDLADKEEEEAAMLSVYLPEGLTESEVREIVQEIVEEGIRDMGPVMGRLMPRLKGRGVPRRRIKTSTDPGVPGRLSGGVGGGAM